MNTHQRSLPALAVFVTAVASAAVMTACGPEKGRPRDAEGGDTRRGGALPPAPRPAGGRTPRTAGRTPSGRVTGVEAIAEAKKPTGAGAVIGGVVGGVVGNQIGDGNGRKVATVAARVAAASPATRSRSAAANGSWATASRCAWTTARRAPCAWARATASRWASAACRRQQPDQAVSLSPAMPSMIRPTQARRIGEAESPSSQMPRITVPTVPMPVLTRRRCPPAAPSSRGPAGRHSRPSPPPSARWAGLREAVGVLEADGPTHLEQACDDQQDPRHLVLQNNRKRASLSIGATAFGVADLPPMP